MQRIAEGERCMGRGCCVATALLDTPTARAPWHVLQRPQPHMLGPGIMTAAAEPLTLGGPCSQTPACPPMPQAWCASASRPLVCKPPLTWAAGLA